MNVSFVSALRVLAVAVAPVVLIAPAAHAINQFGEMKAFEGSDLVAEASGGSVYYESGGVTERIRFRDTDSDGDGAYGQANHQMYTRICAPGGDPCHYGWAGNYEDQTDRYGSAYGWRVSYLHEENYKAQAWRTAPSVCADQNNEPDACGRRDHQQP